MTQEDVRRLLDELGGKATVEEISTQAKEKYPNRSLHTYVGQLLRRLEKKGFVSEVGTSVWELTEKGESTSVSGIEISEISEDIDQSTLNEYGLEVTNLVGTLETEREFDLNLLADVFPHAEYHPESSPFLVYRPIESATLLVPTNGLISVVGAKNPEQMRQAVRTFFEEMGTLGVEIETSVDTILIQNIVTKGDLKVELDLDVLSIGIGLERCEYDPERFPGVICRTERNATVLIFRTGKFLITGSKSYANTCQVASDLYEELQSLGIDVSLN
ncbi:hypothetical protein [Natronococcus roseus]|uniref:hypothetical protein n=1 Tax=Natronococcus roseus TaxID=1052014 RepID=UPI00374D3D97